MKDSPVSLRVLGFGRGFIAIDKPAGMSVHNDPDQQTDALSALAAHLQIDTALAAGCGYQPSRKLHPVHRLDRETSGVLLLATDPASAKELQNQFEAHQTEKIYLAILRGSGLQNEGSWNWSLSDKAEGHANPRGPANARKDCVTQFRVLNRTAHLSEVEIRLLTGRQHQIRRHALLAKHEVVGDTRYGDRRYIQNLNKRWGSMRMYLHAQSLSLKFAQTELNFVAPRPQEFSNAISPDAISPDGEEKPEASVENRSGESR